jgi:hypothetical protein
MASVRDWSVRTFHGSAARCGQSRLTTLLQTLTDDYTTEKPEVETSRARKID